jgi:hypothetical protein
LRGEEKEIMETMQHSYSAGELTDAQLDQIAGGLVDEVVAAFYYAQFAVYVTAKVMSTAAGAVPGD